MGEYACSQRNNGHGRSEEDPERRSMKPGQRDRERYQQQQIAEDHRAFRENAEESAGPTPNIENATNLR